MEHISLLGSVLTKMHDCCVMIQENGLQKKENIQKHWGGGSTIWEFSFLIHEQKRTGIETTGASVKSSIGRFPTSCSCLSVWSESDEMNPNLQYAFR